MTNFFPKKERFIESNQAIAVHFDELRPICPGNSNQFFFCWIHLQDRDESTATVLFVIIFEMFRMAHRQAAANAFSHCVRAVHLIISDKLNNHKMFCTKYVLNEKRFVISHGMCA